MLTMTHAAREHINRMLAECSGEVVVRISGGPHGIQIEPGKVRRGDTTFDRDGKCMLAVDQMILRQISGQTLDAITVDGVTTLELTE